MDDTTTRMLVVATGVVGGVVIGHFGTMHLARKALGRAMKSLVGSTIMATSVMATAYIDLCTEIGKMTPEEAAAKLMKVMAAAGVPVKHISLRSRTNVDKT